MLEVTIRTLPHGDARRARTLGRFFITNEGVAPGTNPQDDVRVYHVEFRESDYGHVQVPVTYRLEHRRRWGWMHLVEAALQRRLPEIKLEDALWGHDQRNQELRHDAPGESVSAAE